MNGQQNDGLFDFREVRAEVKFTPASNRSHPTASGLPAAFASVAFSGKSVGSVL